MKILSPDKQSSIVHKYHKLNFTLLPCMFFVCRDKNELEYSYYV